MKIILGGASGLIGSALQQELLQAGHELKTLVRRKAQVEDEISWLLSGAALDPAEVAWADAVVLLNGASVGHLPWTKKYREKLYESRLKPVSVMVDVLKKLGDSAPKLVSASAVGFYGSQPGVRLTEESPAGDTFLAQLCVAWEDAALEAKENTRVTLLRTASVLHKDAVLKPIVALTKFGLGGPLGSGRQVWPWISLEDEVRAIRHVIEQDLVGPVNLVAPAVTTASEIGREVAATLRKPFFLPAPAFALRLLLGKAADSLILGDAAVYPEKLLASGFEFKHTNARGLIASHLAE